MTFLEAALEILKRERKPLHYKELTEKAMERKLLTFVGRTPEVTMQTQLTSAVKKAPGAPFVRVKPGVFGLLRYPEHVPEPEVAENPEARSEGKSEARSEGKSEGEAPSTNATDRRPGEQGDGRGRRRRRGGRGRRKDRRGDDRPEGTELLAGGSEDVPAPSPGNGEKPEADQAAARDAAHEVADEQEGAEEPNIGSLSAEARAAALAETGVLEGAPYDGENGDDGGDDDDDGDDDDAEDGNDAEVGGETDRIAETDEAAGEVGDVEIDHVQPDADLEVEMEVTHSGPEGEPAPAQPAAMAVAPPPGGATQAASAEPQGQGQGQGQGSIRRVMSPVDAAIEILRGQSPGRGLHVRQIADSAVRRRLIHGEPNEAWRVMRAALASEAKERLRAGVRPRIKSAGSGLYALARRVPDADLEKAEHVFGEARRALRERTLAAVEQRLADLPPASFEALARVVLQREGFGPATFVKRVEGTIYVEALRGRGLRPSKCLIALRPGIAAAGRRALGELRAGIRARGQDEGVLILAGRLADDAISEWKQSGQPVEVVDGPALAETCVRHGIGVVSSTVTVDLVDADFFVELSEG